MKNRMPRRKSGIRVRLVSGALAIGGAGSMTRSLSWPASNFANVVISLSSPRLDSQGEGTHEDRHTWRLRPRRHVARSRFSERRAPGRGPEPQTDLGAVARCRVGCADG